MKIIQANASFRLWAFGVVAMTAGLLCSRATAREQSFLMVEKGLASAAIVIPDEGSWAQEEKVADLVRSIVRDMTGAELPIVKESALGEIVIKDNRIIPAQKPPNIDNYLLVGTRGLAKRLNISTDGIGIGGIRLCSRANSLTLLGGPDRIAGEIGSDTNSLRHAAVELLEQLGCRYLWPGPLGMATPKTDTLTAPNFDLSYTPPIRSRFIRGGKFAITSLSERPLSGIDQLNLKADQWIEAKSNAVKGAPEIEWCDWQRLGGDMPIFFHNQAGFTDAEEHLEKHPEWFALQGDGTRDQRGSSRLRLCKSNPELIAHVAGLAIKLADENPDLVLISLDPSDGSGVVGWCQCEKCKALDPPNAPLRKQIFFAMEEKDGKMVRQRKFIQAPSLTDRMMFYWNSIAEIVAEKHPDLRFGVSAYGAFSYPPVLRKAHPNLYVRYVPYETEDFQGWMDAGAKHIYWRPNVLISGDRHGKMCSFAVPYAERLRYFVDRGVNQIDVSAFAHSWGVKGLTYYAAARLAWNPYLSVENIIDDFATAGFGAGAADIKAYLERIEALTAQVVQDDDDNPIPIVGVSAIKGSFDSEADYRYTPEVVAELRAMLDSAERKADDESISKRIALVRMGLNFTELHEHLDYLSLLARNGGKEEKSALRQKARPYIDLNTLMIRDLLLNHPLVLNIPQIVWGSAGFARFRSVGGRRTDPSDPDMLKVINTPGHIMTGRENSLEELMKLFAIPLNDE